MIKQTQKEQENGTQIIANGDNHEHDHGRCELTHESNKNDMPNHSPITPTLLMDVLSTMSDTEHTYGDTNRFNIDDRDGSPSALFTDYQHSSSFVDILSQSECREDCTSQMLQPFQVPSCALSNTTLEPPSEFVFQSLSRSTSATSNFQLLSDSERIRLDPKYIQLLSALLYNDVMEQTGTQTLLERSSNNNASYSLQTSSPCISNALALVNQTTVLAIVIRRRMQQQLDSILQ